MLDYIQDSLTGSLVQVFLRLLPVVQGLKSHIHIEPGMNLPCSEGPSLKLDVDGIVNDDAFQDMLKCTP